MSSRFIVLLADKEQTKVWTQNACRLANLILPGYLRLLNLNNKASKQNNESDFFKFKTCRRFIAYFNCFQCYFNFKNIGQHTINYKIFEISNSMMLFRQKYRVYRWGTYGNLRRQMAMSALLDSKSWEEFKLSFLRR